VTSLNGQDGASGSQVGLGHDVRGRTEVGGNTNTLKDLSGCEERLNISVAEVVCAGIDRFCSSGAQGTSEERHVGLLVAGDGGDAGANIVGEASGLEGGSVVLGKTLAVEGILKVLKSKSVVEDVGISDGSLLALSGRSGGDGSKSRNGEECGLHSECSEDVERQRTVLFEILG